MDQDERDFERFAGSERPWRAAANLLLVCQSGPIWQLFRGISALVVCFPREDTFWPAPHIAPLPICSLPSVPNPANGL